MLESLSMSTRELHFILWIMNIISQDLLHMERCTQISRNLHFSPRLF